MTTTTKTTTIPTIAATVTGATLYLAFSNGEKLTIGASDLTDEIRAAAMMHGLKQKLVDAAAISRNPETGRSATVQDKFDAVREVADRLLAGEWNKAREGGAGSGVSLLLAALIRLYDGRKTKDEVVAFLDGKTDAEKAALRANPKVAPIIAEIKAEREAAKPAAKGLDTDAMLDELDA